MPPAKKKTAKAQTVFFGRETAVLREDVQNIEDDPENDEPRVVSDILYDSCDEIEESESTSSHEETAPPLKRARSSPVIDDEVDSGAVATAPKRQRRANKTEEVTIRRSARTSTTANVKEEPAPAMPKKRGRGRPPKEPKPAKEPDHGGPQHEWEVEKIVGSQIDVVTQEHFYRVKWKGFPSADNTWEPKKNLTGCNRAIQAFEKGLAQ
ncbi:hypothetical protein G7Z17_g10428 [Cylindrodendrum hubeiense]|uniref:Chromo domain-containing protein n=1 Tax=Cylindrodendrum hubeiense TaxID=595255 RepID=A0A9P5GXQ2_9HYPO|nr:hypothetical protein G7Z17_g10428 [Cylindrodendrum hubeiense]